MWLRVHGEISKYFINTLKIAENCTSLAFKQQGYILLCVIYETKVKTSLFLRKFCYFLQKKKKNADVSKILEDKITGKEGFFIPHEFNKKTVNIAQKTNGDFLCTFFDQNNDPICKSKF